VKKLFLFLLLLPALAKAEEFAIKDLSGGMYSNISANQIPDNAAVDIENFYTDVEPLAIERNGSEKRDTTLLGSSSVKTVTGLWEFVDNTGQQWIISYASHTFYKNTLGNTPTQFGLQATTNNQPDCAVNLGKIWCVNGVDSGWSFDGTSTSTVSGMPLGTLIEPWRNRLIVANIASNQSTVRVSADGDGTSWTIGALATSPFSFQIGGANDGFNVTCTWKSYLDNFVIGRKRDMWYLSGFDQSDYQVRNISSEIGCIQQGSMREFDGSLLFLSNRGMEEMKGYTITSISEPIRDITDKIVKNTVNFRTSVYSTDADWNAGVSTPTLQLSTVPLSGSLSAKTTSFALTSAADWNGGTFDVSTYVDTTTTTGTIQTKFPDEFSAFRNSASNGNIWYAASDGTDGSGDWALSENIVGGSTLQILLDTAYCNTTPRALIGTNQPLNNFSAGSTFYFTLVDVPPPDSGGYLNNFYFVLNSGRRTTTDNALNLGSYFILTFRPPSAGNVTFVSAANSGTLSNTFNTVFKLPISVALYADSAKYQITVYNVAGSSQMAKASQSVSFAPYAHFVYRNTSCNSTAGDDFFSLDNFTVQPQTFTYTSAVFDTGMSSPTWGNFQAVASTVAVTYTTQASADGSSFDSAVAVTTNSFITSASKRYLKSTVLFTHDYSTFPAVVTSLDSLTVTAAASGTFTSAPIFLSSSISSFGPVTIHDTHTGSSRIDYQFTTSTSPDVTSFSTGPWLSILSGGVPTNTVHNYVAFRASFSVTSGTDSVSIQDVSITWNDGTAQQTSSWVYDKRYWISYTTSTAAGATTDRVLVYQRNRTWILLTGIYASSFATWRDALYFGNSNNTGYVYKFDTGNNDDGAAISSNITFKSYDLGDFSREKDLRNVYVNFLGDSSFAGNFTLGYDVDRAGTLYSLGVRQHDGGHWRSSRQVPISLVESDTGARSEIHAPEIRNRGPTQTSRFEDGFQSKRGALRWPIISQPCPRHNLIPVYRAFRQLPKRPRAPTFKPFRTS
jgi:hypothetical protein